MVAEGEKMITEGWAMFEEAVGQAGTGELPQLLRSIRTSVTATRMMKEEGKMEEELMKGEEGEGEASGGMTVTPVREGAQNPQSQSRLKWRGEGVIQI